MDLLVNIDVPDLVRAIAFYSEAFGLIVSRRFGTQGAELSGWPVRLYLLQKAEGSAGAGESLRRYDRHWTPVHLDIVVEDLDAALSRAVAAGARAETEIRTAAWGKIVVLADPFGHGLCLIEFLGRGYGEIAEPVPPGSEGK
jgi:predicted enzyme related to lactoylglutathione lyase